MRELLNDHFYELIAGYENCIIDYCQNGKVQRSHREDGKILYGRKVFTSEKELIRQMAKHEKRYSSTAKTMLQFKSPNQVVSEYFSKV